MIVFCRECDRYGEQTEAEARAAHTGHHVLAVDPAPGVDIGRLFVFWRERQTP